MNTNTSPATLSTNTIVADDPNGEPTNISPQPETETKPRAEWDADEIFDGRPKSSTIQILVVPPGAAPYAHTLETMQQLIGGYITSFDTGIFDTVGIAHDEGLLLQLPPNRLIPATGAVIFGTFFIAGSGINLHSLTPEQMSEAAELFEHPLRLQQLAQLLQRQRADADTDN